MLNRLIVNNFSLLESVDITFKPGLNILTGETGSGKSILMEALGLVLGNRADLSYLRNPNQKCWVEATFKVPQNESFDGFLAEFFPEIEFSDTNTEMVIRREILPNGKSRAFVDDTPTALQTLKSLTGFLVDFHRQHENLKILNPAEQLQLLDQFSDNQLLIHEIKAIFDAFTQKQQDLSSLKNIEHEGTRKKDYLTHVVQDLTAAKISISEEIELDTTLQRLENAEFLLTTLKSAIYDFYENEQSVQTLLSKHQKAIQKLTSIDGFFQHTVESLTNLLIHVEDIANQLQSKCDEIETDPEKLSYINQRIETYQRLKLKYSTKKTADLLQTLANSQHDLSQIESVDAKIKEIELELTNLGETLFEKCYQLEQKRENAAQSLSAAINQILPELGLANARFSIVVGRISNSKTALPKDNAIIYFQPNGMNTCNFMITTNLGIPEANLDAVASGGEISRILLAIKAVLAEKMQFPCLVFDEIDTGISGSIALQVGFVIENLAKHSQILCITHLPQVASRGKNHFFLSKTHLNNATYTHIRELDKAERIRQIAIMLSEDPPSPAAIANATELLNSEQRKI